jgi:hypothetical protein
VSIFFNLPHCPSGRHFEVLFGQTHSARLFFTIRYASM